MSKAAAFAKYWLPALLWMTIIFSASTDAMSSKRTSRIIGPFLRWLKPDISEKTVGDIQFLIRKTAHVTEYALLGWLTWRAVRQPARGDCRPWGWREAGIAFAIAALYSISDEVHQSFVPSREGNPLDVMLDSFGAAVGILLRWLTGRWRKEW